MKPRISLLAFLYPVVIHSQSIYIHPRASSSNYVSVISPSQANLILSYHLRLDAFEPLDPEVKDEPQDDQLVLQYLTDELDSGFDFVGEGLPSALIVSVEGLDKEFIPKTISQHPLQLSLPTADSDFSFSSLISTYLHRAAHVYTTLSSSRVPSSPPSHIIDIFGVSNSEAVNTFLCGFSSLVEFLDSVDEEAKPHFGAFEIRGLDDIRNEFGSHSEQYRTASQAIKAALQSATTKPLSLALLTTGASSPFVKRQPPPPQSPLSPNQNSSLPPQEPFFSSSTCYATLSACTNATNSCSGHGACTNATRVGNGGKRTCFVCACQATVTDKGAKEIWVGTACERKDISGPFAMLVGTSIFLILLAIGAISLLYSVGTQELPGTLTAGTTSSKRN